MDERASLSDSAPVDRFAWHPTYAGRSADEASAAILADLQSDQRAHALALEGADRHESDALTTIVRLERKWGPFDLDWAEADPDVLADRVLAFEQERERRRVLFPYREVRDRAAPAVPTAAIGRAPFRVGPPLVGAAVIVLALLVLALLLLR